MPWPFSFSRKRPPETQLDAELRYHVDRLIDEKIAAGQSHEQAQREAVLEFGGREQMKEELRDVHRVAVLESLVANVKSGFRLIRRSPTFAIAVVLTLALGIGANSAVFSALDAILLRPLAFPHGEELMLMLQTDRKAKSPKSFVAPVRLEDWNRLAQTFQSISGWYTQDASESSGALPEKVTEALVAPRFLQTWGIAPMLGRDFSPEEEHFGGPNAILISNRFWQRRFNGDPAAVGKRLRLEKNSYTVIGVMPPLFLFPDQTVEVWATSPADAPYAQGRDATWFNAIGRLKADVTVSQARADLDNVQTLLARQFPKSDANLGVYIQPLKENTVGGVRRSLWILFGSVSLLLLIACTNIAALLLARTTEREREIAVRFSLGASRSSIIAQLLTECLVLAFGGAALGLFIAAASAKFFRAYAKSFPRVEEITLDWRIVLYTLVCAIVAALLCGLFPAIRGTRRSIAGELAHASRSQVSSKNSIQWVLVGIQVALAVTLLAGAGLLLRSFEELGRVSPGFDYSHVLTLRISANWGETNDRKGQAQRIDRTLDALRSLPGIRGAATAGSLPGIAGQVQTELKVVGRADTDRKILADTRFVSDGYFAAMKIPMVMGQGCLRTKNSIVVVNRSFASKYLAGSSALGHSLQLISNFPIPPAEIEGIVGDAREQGLSREPVPTVYWCLNAPTPSPYFLIRTQSEPMAMAETLRRKIHSLEPARSVYGISALEEHLSDSFAENRLRTMLLTLFALTAVSLACIGLYGTLSYSVSVRRREVGLRLALGAERRQILWQFLRRGLTVSFIGCLIGLCLALAFGRALTGMLYGVSPTDSETYLSIVLLIVGVATAASILPALRAAKVDPMKVLRDE